ncbi:MAG TPA: hypothetical protein VK980_05285 [Sphingomonas sp.]|nr:hypothetical protein [Sphingomonas sp.]
MIDSFAAQFESDGKGGYLYRHYGRGAGTPVSAPERKAFIRIYGLESRWLLPGVAIGTVIVIVANVFFYVALQLHGEAPAYLGMIGGTGIIMAAVLMANKRSYDAPRRDLAGRASVGPERSRSEATAIAVARQSWGQLLVGFVVIAGGLAMQALNHDVLHGWGRLWWLFFALGAAAIGYAAIRKWRSQID